MGTNYYLRPNGGNHDNPDYWVHLGKASVGWPFMFRAYPDGAYIGDTDGTMHTVKDSDSWAALMDYGDPFDEYGVEVHKHYMRGMVKRGASESININTYDFMDGMGNHFITRDFS
jgi:hypothetical protein